MSEPLVLFDGSCGFRRVTVTCLARAPRLRLAARLLPYRSADLASYGLTERQARDRMRLVRDGELHGGARAFAAWFATGGPAARTVGRTPALPGVRHTAEAAYRSIARNRHRIPRPWERTCTI